MRIILIISVLFFSGKIFAQDADTTVYKYVDKEAEFPGGYSAIMNWIWKNVVFDVEEDLTGKIAVSFIVEKDGSVSHVKAEYNNYVSSVVAKIIPGMPVWTPARNNGKICRSQFLLAVSCILFE